MSEMPIGEPSCCASPNTHTLSQLRKEDIPSYLAFVAEQYPLLIDVLGRVARDLIKEGVDIRRLADGDLSVLAIPL